MTSVSYSAPVLFALLTLAAASAGHLALRRLWPQHASRPSAIPSALAIGYGVMACGLAVLGLLGQLRVLPALAWVAALLLLGARSLPALWALCAGLSRRAAAALDCGRLSLLALVAVLVILLSAVLLGTGASGMAPLWIAAVASLVLAALTIWEPRHGIAWTLLTWATLTLLANLAPPADLDWDGLAEHLAQARVYAQTAHFAPIWYDHHSHFPALLQMLYTLGLLLQGPALARLFHWAFGLLALAAAGSIADNHLSRGSGKWAALALATTPLVGVLMQLGYVDLATTAYSLLALLAFLQWRRDGLTSSLALCALMVAGAMSTKMQGIPLFGILGLATVLIVLRRRWPLRRAVAQLAAFGSIVLLVAGPWYARSWVNTGNPVYPFAYGVFGGKYWGPTEARQYDYHQKEFGPDHLPPADTFYALPRLQRMFTGPRSPLNLILAPWNITFNPVPFTDQWRQGDRALTSVLLTAWIGPLYFAGLLALLIFRLRPGAALPSRQWEGLPAPTGPATTPALWRTCALIIVIFLPLWLWWLASMQFARYLLPSLALIAPCLGLACVLSERRRLHSLPALWAAAALTGLCVVSAPPLSCVSGMLPAEQYLLSSCQVYEPSAALNKLVPPGGKVITYGEPRGFYITPAYMWGDPGHHRLIPYDTLRTPEALVSHLRGMGITHALVNQAFAGRFDPTAGGPTGLLARAARSGLIRPITDPPLRRREYIILDLRAR